MAESKFPYFCLGLGIGTALGLLFAPKAGEEVREGLRHRALEGRDYIKHRSEDLRHQAGEVLERGRSTVQTQRDQLAAALEAGRKAYRETTAEKSESPAETAPTS